MSENSQGNGSGILVDVQSLSRQLAQVLSNPEDEAAQELITLMRRVVTPPSTIDVDANGVVHEQVRYSDMPKQAPPQDLIQKGLLQYAKGDKDKMSIESDPFPKVEINMVNANLAKRLGSTVERQKQGEGDRMETDEESAKSQSLRFPNDYLCIRSGREIKYGEAIIAEKEQKCAFSKSGLRFNTMGGNDLQIYVGAKLIYEGIDPRLFNRIESEHCYGPDDGPFLFRGHPVVPARPGVPFSQELEAVGYQFPSRGRYSNYRGAGSRREGWYTKVSTSQKRRLQRKFAARMYNDPWDHVFEHKEKVEPHKVPNMKLMEADDDDLLNEESEQEDLIKDTTPSPQKSATFGESLATIQFGSVPINYQCHMILVLPKHFKAKPDQPMELAGDVEDKTQSTVKIVEKEEETQSQLINVETDEKGTEVVVLRPPDDASIRHLKPLYTGGMEVFWADQHPFQAETNNVEADLYKEHLWPMKIEDAEVKSNGIGVTERSEELATVKATFKRLFSFLVDKKLQACEPISCNWAECVFDDSPLTMKDLGLADLKPAPAKLDDDRAQVKDPTRK
ncbi:hypothetical protein RHSIM_RhsimUnG0049600 [Rhododendron simsii]|uniref:Uncharacterized protein n=1 Tax=Rhododendron simsii TaxID=118357 RepID=A0A834L4X1_RHOSS|nr:hypothetical protein RHSIM_RhsimUnG0049600 [Rhododendron simsii]